MVCLCLLDAKLVCLVQMKEKLALYLVAMRCCAHCTNLAIQTLSSLSIVHHLEDLLQSFDSYFVRNPKRVFELQKLATFLNTKAHKILRNVKTYWFSMLSPSKWVVAKYKTFIAKILRDQIEIKATRSNLQNLSNLEFIFGLHCILPLLELVHTLIKYAQGSIHLHFFWSNQNVQR
jgi:hypothetical protein